MRAGRVVLRSAGVRVRGVCVLHVSTLRAGYVCISGRACETAGRGMTARGPGAPAAAAPPPRAPHVPAPPAPRRRLAHAHPTARARAAAAHTLHRHLAITLALVQKLNSYSFIVHRCQKDTWYCRLLNDTQRDGLLCAIGNL